MCIVYLQNTEKYYEIACNCSTQKQNMFKSDICRRATDFSAEHFIPSAKLSIQSSENMQSSISGKKNHEILQLFYKKNCEIHQLITGIFVSQSWNSPTGCVCVGGGMLNSLISCMKNLAFLSIYCNEKLLNLSICRRKILRHSHISHG